MFRRRRKIEGKIGLPRHTDDRARLGDFHVRFVTQKSFDFQYREIFRERQYLFETDSSTPFVVDCGANIGMSVLYFKGLYPDARVLAFEPDPGAFACLRENVTGNALPDVRIENAAVTGVEGETDFFYDRVDPASLRMSIVRERMPKDRRTVRAVRLSRFLDEEVDFLKLDVEGAELDVIGELADARKLRLVRQMLVEYHHHIVRTEDRFSRLLALFEEDGFGYQIEGHIDRPLPRERTQDVRVYAYRKS
jgi:FkbM family methyltransferase